MGLKLADSHSVLRHLSPLTCRRYPLLGEARVLLPSPRMNLLPGSSTINRAEMWTISRGDYFVLDYI